MEHLEDEYSKILTYHDFSSDKEVEYRDKLHYETQVIALCSNVSDYLTKKNYGHEEKCRVYMRQLEHIYYRVDPTVGKKEEINSYKEMRRLCGYITSRDETDRLRTRAILCHIYYLALHDYWFEARDMMAMSGLTNLIDRADASTQILFNRVTVQLGLCAFRRGCIKEAHQALAELQGSGRVKEILAQGTRLNRNEATADELYREKLFLQPYHKHINVDVIECAYLVSAMLTDVNHCHMQQADGRRVMISRNFHYVLKNNDRTTINGRPDNLKEHVVAASKALFIGDWKTAADYIFDEKMKKSVWALFRNYEELKLIIIDKIKLESMKAFLLGNANGFDSLSLKYLADVYELSGHSVHQMISKMILDGKLKASLDEPSNCLIMHRTRSSGLQIAALKMADKIFQLAELNEKLQDAMKPRY